MTYTMSFRIALHYYTYMDDESLFNHQFTWWMEILPRKLDGFVSIKMSKTIIWISVNICANQTTTLIQRYKCKLAQTSADITDALLKSSTGNLVTQRVCLNINGYKQRCWCCWLMVCFFCQVLYKLSSIYTKNYGKRVLSHRLKSLPNKNPYVYCFLAEWSLEAKRLR